MKFIHTKCDPRCDVYSLKFQVKYNFYNEYLWACDNWPATDKEIKKKQKFH